MLLLTNTSRWHGFRVKKTVDLILEINKGDTKVFPLVTGPGLTDNAAQLLLGEILLVHQALKGFGFFDRGQVLALQVFDQGEFGVVALDKNGGEGGQADLLGCLPAALTCHDGELSLACITEKERLDDAELSNGGDKLGKGFWVYHLAGLIRVRVSSP